jgi:NADH-quinone oxidoreductase subunit M
VIIMGVYPASFQNVYNPTVEKILADHQASLKAAGLIEAAAPETAALRTETPATQPASEN